MADLRVWTDDCDSCIAEDIEGVKRAMVAYGITECCFVPEHWDTLPDDEEITIHCDAGGNPATPGDDGVSPVTKTAREWCARGPGFLCTTEY